MNETLARSLPLSLALLAVAALALSGTASALDGSSRIGARAAATPSQIGLGDAAVVPGVGAAPVPGHRAPESLPSPLVQSRSASDARRAPAGTAEADARDTVGPERRWRVGAGDDDFGNGAPATAPELGNTVAFALAALALALSFSRRAGVTAVHRRRRAG